MRCQPDRQVSQRWYITAVLVSFLAICVVVLGARWQVLAERQETFEEGLMTIRLAKELRSFYTEFFPITPFPGAELYENSQAYGRILRDMSDTGMLKEEIPFEPYTMTADEIAELRRRAYKAVYLDPRYILMRILSIRSWFEMKTILNGAVSLLKIIFKNKRETAEY